jgi:alpha-beta hydrolase superfamily lysophospholipase
LKATPNIEQLRALRMVAPKFELERRFDSEQHPAFEGYRALYNFAEAEAECSRYGAGIRRLGDYDVMCHYWHLSESKAHVFLVHGLFDHVGLFTGMVADLLRQGYSVFALDLPEHGLSEGEFGQVSDFSEYAHVVDDFSRRLAPKISNNWFAISQSTGGAVMMHHLLRQGSASIFKKQVLLAPLIRPRAYLGVLLSYRLLSPFLKRVKRSFTMNSNDAEFCRFLREDDPLQPQHISVNWVGAMIAWVKGFDRLARSNIPSLLIQGTEDKTVDFKFNIQKISEHFSHVDVKYIEGAMHHLPRESAQYRDQILDAAFTFLDDEVAG